MRILFLCLFAGLLNVGSAHGQSFGKIDTTLKVGKTGYRVDCKNDDINRNLLRIRPVGFDGAARELNFYIKGFVTAEEIGDINNDGFPDLVLYLALDSGRIFGTVVAFLSDANKAILSAALADPMLDGKINEGYRGHDQFIRMESYLQQKFPIYKPGDNKDNPTGGTRVVLYQMVKKPEGGFKYDKVRFYDIK
jgi:hypothetical protein